MKAWLLHHAQAIMTALRRLAGAPINTLLAMGVIGITLAIPAGGYLLLANLTQLAGGKTPTPQVIVYLKVEATAAQSQTLGARLRALGAGEVRLIERAQTLQMMRNQWQEALSVLPDNPFPDTWVLIPVAHTPQTLKTLADDIRSWPQVEQVAVDTEWADRLAALLRLGHRVVLLLALLLGIGAMTIIFNTIRLQLLSQRAEIEVSRLLGATDAWIGRPYYYFGACQGMLGALAAMAVVVWAGHWLEQPLAQLAQAYGQAFQFGLPAWRDILIFLGLTALLGWLSAVFSLFRHLGRG